MKRLKLNPKLTYVTLLALWAASGFSAFSGLAVNPLLRTYGLALFLQAGFALVYLSDRRQQRQQRQQRPRTRPGYSDF
ncbi:MAG: hypothetical protein HC910_11945 [Spirulinaceae cyanobacterium SM2_1_0]|nr:hypothetical protein [Spirulinaceae cyanobacterium SM2_1_0]